ncbi:hypothetical protein GQ600_10763 [Phytophthora cactorum]|nr:hypothetical protein GQ600_10763 [Phytophthora cactorum]
MEIPLANTFHSAAAPHTPEDELEAVDSPDNDFFLSGYPASITDLDFAATVQALPTHQNGTAPSSSSQQLKAFDEGMLHQPLNLPLSHRLSTTSRRRRSRSSVHPPQKLALRQLPTRASPRGIGAEPHALVFAIILAAIERKRMKDSEEILNAPVKSLTEEEKKLRRRAQVAKSARKHRNRQKEELTRLREQMAIMTHHQGSSSPTSIKREQDVITQHRKRKKVDEDDEGVGGGVLTNPNVGLISMPPPKPHIQHWYHRLPIDTLELWRWDVVSFNGYKLNSNGPDLEIKQVRGRLVSGFTHHEVGEACWNSFSNFLFDVPERFRRHVTCERLMELDSNTRYGRTIVPLLRDHKGRIVYFHSYFLVRRHVRDDYVMITWETITDDDLYPPSADENPETTLRNDEVGCMILESERMADQGVRTTFRSITHSTPPVGVMTHPRGKVNEAFLTVFCRNADTVENSAWNLLMKTHPERMPKAEVVV